MGQEVEKEDSDEDHEEKRDKVEELATMAEPLRLFIIKLNDKIENMTKMVPHRFESYERAIALLTSIENKIPSDNYLKLICQIELQKARRLQAEHKNYSLKWKILKNI